MRKRCTKQGHSLRLEQRQTLRPGDRTCVAFKVSQERAVCRRLFCGFKGPWCESAVLPVHGLTLDSAVMSRLEAGEEVVL